MATPALVQALPPAHRAESLPVLVRPGDGQVIVSDYQLRQDAQHIELGWLADPMTFGYQLVARPVEGKVEVAGYVPNEAIKRHVLEVARASATATVVDQLKLHPSLAVRTPGNTTGDLRKEAASLLLEAFPGQASNFALEAEPDGKVVVTGSVGSVEDKLAVSKRLRRLGGCTCVENRLAIGAVASMTRPAPVAVPVPVAAAPQVTEVASPVPVAPVSRADRTTWMQPTPTSWVQTPAPVPASTGIAQASVQTSEPLPVILPVKAEEPALPVPARTQPVPEPSGATPLLHATTAPAAPPPMPKPLSEETKTVAALMPSHESPTLLHKEPSAPEGGAYVSTGVILRKSEKAPPSPEAGGAYVSKGTMIITRHSSAPAEPVAVPVAALRQRIAAVCGKAVHDLELVPLAEGKVEVRFKAASAADGERLTAQIVAIPELAPYQLSFQVRLDH
jgi:hypothetical protein